MIDLGATTLWETYDTDWPKDDFHHEMQVGDAGGYFTSLSHSWSSGPTAWLMEEILGILPLEPGFTRTRIRPDLAGLKWARGSMPTPHGLIAVSAREDAGFHATVEVPAGIEALVSLPVNGGKSLLLDSKPVQGSPAEAGARAVVAVKGPGKFEFSSK